MEQVRDARAPDEARGPPAVDSAVDAITTVTRDWMHRWDPSALRVELAAAIDYAEASYLAEDTGTASSLFNASVSTIAELSRGATEILDLGTGAAKGWAQIEQARDGWDYAVGVSLIAKDAGLAAGAILGALGVTGQLRLVSRIKESSGLVREAEVAGRSHQAGLDHLVGELARGHLNPGKGTRWLNGVKGVREARHGAGARVYFRVKDQAVEILGKSNKANQNSVIRLIGKAFDL
jgi:hypothetical protein